MYAVLFDVEQLKGEPRTGRGCIHCAEYVPETELARAWFENDLVLAVGGSQLPCDLLRAIRTVVVDDDHLPSEVTTLLQTTHQRVPRARGVPLVKKKSRS